MASSVLEALVVLGLGGVAYSYAVYPLLLALVAALTQLVRDARYVLHKSDRRRAPAMEPPAVAVVISAYNEQRHVRERVVNLLALDYPADRLRVYIGSDGSQDETGAILRSIAHPQVRSFVFETNRGKATVLNDLMAEVQEPIVVFSDANTCFDREAVRILAAHFADPEVGAVSGELRLTGSSGDNQDSLYWRVEQMLKFFEGRIGGLLGANGGIYAIRRELWRPLRPDTICDDFCVAMNIAARKHRLVYEPRAHATEDTPPNIGDEYKRRVRIGIGNFQALVRHPEYLFGTRGATAWAYLSHKVLRWLAPHLLILALAASCLLGLDSPGWAAFAAAQVAVYALAAGLYARSTRGLALPGLLRILAFLFALNWAFLVASYRYAFGHYSGSWKTTSR